MVVVELEMELIDFMERDPVDHGFQIIGGEKMRADIEVENTSRNFRVIMIVMADRRARCCGFCVTGRRLTRVCAPCIMPAGLAAESETPSGVTLRR